MINGNQPTFGTTPRSVSAHSGAPPLRACAEQTPNRVPMLLSEPLVARPASSGQHDPVWFRVVVGVVVAGLALWVAFAVTLVAIRPRAVNLRDARRAVPDVIRLLRSLHGDRSLPSGVRWWLHALLVYLALPIDLVPDFVPVLGYADDVIIVALVLRRVARLAGVAAIEQHWTGDSDGLAVVRRLAGLRATNNP